MAIYFLGLKLTTPFNISRRVTSATSYSWNGAPDDSERPDARMHLTAGVVPDFQGHANLAGRVKARLRKYGTAVAFDEVIPQDLGTLDASQAARFVRGKTDAGANEVVASGSIDGLKEGRVITFGSDKRMYLVEGVDTDTNTIELDLPLAVDLANNTAINMATPIGSWHFTQATVDDPPSTLFGVNAGVEWILECIEAA